jgi:arylformamidase
MIDPKLEALYNNRAAVPEHPQIFARWHAQSLATYAAHTCVRDLAYGTHAKQTLDLFVAPQNRGLVIFIHGGYWRSLDKSDFAFMAEPYLAAGISVANINYRLCPEVGIEAIADDCRAAIGWLHAHVVQHGATFERVLLAGHSAGAHLVAMMFATQWASRGIQPGAFCGGLAISGIYDLVPLLQVSMNADLQLDRASAAALSPIQLTPTLQVPLLMVVGRAESSEFIRQTHLLPTAWREVCAPVDEIDGANHFTIVDASFRPGARCLKKSLQRIAV